MSKAAIATSWPPLPCPMARPTSCLHGCRLLLALLALLAATAVAQQSSAAAAAFTRSGQPCKFPAVREGRVVKECVPIGAGDRRYCQARGARGAAQLRPSVCSEPPSPGK